LVEEMTVVFKSFEEVAILDSVALICLVESANPKIDLLAEGYGTAFEVSNS
jgi:hypothetical protein